MHRAAAEKSSACTRKCDIIQSHPCHCEAFEAFSILHLLRLSTLWQLDCRGPSEKQNFFNKRNVLWIPGLVSFHSLALNNDVSVHSPNPIPYLKCEVRSLLTLCLEIIPWSVFKCVPAGMKAELELMDGSNLKMTASPQHQKCCHMIYTYAVQCYYHTPT